MRLPEPAAPPSGLAATSAARPVSLTIQLVAGDVCCRPAPTILTTVLGSCVAVCLWDPRRRAGGMNHFVLPRDPAGGISPRYGDVAMQQLLAGMIALGSRVPDLQAKVVGGAAVLPADREATVGWLNIQHALGWLQARGIPVIGQRTGGLNGQQVRFHTDTCDLFSRPVQSFYWSPPP